MKPSINSAAAKKEKALFWGVLLCAALLYIANAVRSPLWYDEAIEYFYSKVMTGTVPSGGDTTTMYQRICSTYQPPLYNVLLYVWLFFFDFGDFSFRLSSILLTLAGGAGLYKCLKELTGSAGALAGLVLYLLTDKVMYYGLECAEYCLLLCCLCWTLYFFVKEMRSPATGSLIGFFVMAALSVYSQYGAVFLVVPLYLALLLHNRHQTLKKMMLGTLVVLVVAAAPLVVFFLIPQMANQGSISVSHAPVFETNLILDYIKGILRVINYCFLFSSTISFPARIPAILVCFALLLALLGYICQRKNVWVLYGLSVCVLSYTMYFAAVTFSYYGYNDWQGTQGTINLGQRYCLFFAPVIVVVLVYGLHLTWKKISIKWNWSKSVWSVGLCVAGVMFCCLSFYDVAKGWQKDDVRDLVQVWYEQNAYEKTTILHDWSNANFQFYMLHDGRCQPACQTSVRETESWIREASPEEMAERFDEVGVFSLSELYYVGPVEQYAASYHTFYQVMQEHGYTVTELYKGQSALLYLEKQPAAPQPA